MELEFIETPTFTRLIIELLDDDEYRELQGQLLENPEAGKLIRGGGGIRKIRFALSGKGKSGGIRAIYYWMKNKDQIYMLVAYPKSDQDNLTDKQKAILRNLVKGL